MGSLLLRFVFRSTLREQFLLFLPELFFRLTRLLQLGHFLLPVLWGDVRPNGDG